MKNANLFGSLIVISGMIILTCYGMYLFATSEEIPLIIRLAVLSIIIGVAIILLSLIIERLKEIKKR